MINDEIILQVRLRRLNGVTYVQLSTEFQLPLHTIRAICKNIMGRHISLGIECQSFQYQRRNAIGSQAGKAKLNEENVKTIRELIDQGFALKQIASFYNVCISTISDISQGRSWKHLPQNEDEENSVKSV